MLPGPLREPKGLQEMEEEERATWAKKKKAWDGGVRRQIRVKLTERGYIPYVCTILLFWHLYHVIQRYFLRIRPEFAVITSDLIPAGSDELTDEHIEMLAQRAIEMELERGGTLLTRRVLLAVAHLGIRRDTAELGDLLRRRADADRQRAASAYAIPGFLFWAIPILGFVGTVLGIGLAIGNLEGALATGVEAGAGEAGMAGISKALSDVAANLGVAFDTTLVALLMSIVAMLVQTLVRQQESRLLADVEDYLTYRLQSRIKTESQDVRIDRVLRTSLKELHDLQERIHEEAQDRASVTMQTMMTAQQNIKDALGEMPELLEKAATQSSQLIDETRLKLEGIGDLAADRLAATFAEAVKDTRRDLTGMREAVMQGVAQATDSLIAQSVSRCREAMGSLDQSLAQVVQDLAKLLNEGQQLLVLQNAMSDNVDQLQRIHNLGEAFIGVRQAINTLAPMLERLSRPVPPRLSLGGAEISDGAGAARVVPGGGM
jgi:biopolymer transport protein ExbB/TolQ